MWLLMPSIDFNGSCLVSCPPLCSCLDYAFCLVFELCVSSSLIIYAVTCKARGKNFKQGNRSKFAFVLSEIKQLPPQQNFWFIHIIAVRKKYCICPYYWRALMWNEWTPRVKFIKKKGSLLPLNFFLLWFKIILGLKLHQGSR